MFFKLCLNSVAITLWGLVAQCRLYVHIRFFQNICCFSDDSTMNSLMANTLLFPCILVPTILTKNKQTKKPEYAPSLNKTVVIIMIIIPVTHFRALQSCVYLWKIPLIHLLTHIFSYCQNYIYRLFHLCAYRLQFIVCTVVIMIFFLVQI